MAFQMTEMSSRMSFSVSATSCAVSSVSFLPILVRGVRSSSILATASRAAFVLPGLSGCGVVPLTPLLRAGGARFVSASDADEVPPLASSNSSSSDELAELNESASSSTVTAATPAAIWPARVAWPVAEALLAVLRRLAGSAEPMGAPLRDVELDLRRRLGGRPVEGLLAPRSVEANDAARLAVGVKPFPSTGTERMREFGDAELTGKRRSPGLTLPDEEDLHRGALVSLRSAQERLKRTTDLERTEVADEMSLREKDEVSLADELVREDELRNSPISAKRVSCVDLGGAESKGARSPPRTRRGLWCGGRRPGRRAVVSPLFSLDSRRSKANCSQLPATLSLT